MARVSKAYVQSAFAEGIDSKHSSIQLKLRLLILKELHTGEIPIQCGNTPQHDRVQKAVELFNQTIPIDQAIYGIYP